MYKSIKQGVALMVIMAAGFSLACNVIEMSNFAESVQMSDEPEDVISLYCEASLSKGDEDIAKLITTVPGIHWQNWAEKSLQDEMGPLNSDSTNISVETSRPKLSKYLLEKVSEHYPAFIRRHQLYVENVVSRKVVGNIAQIKVRFQSKLDSNFVNTTMSEKDFFLYLGSDGKWKIYDIIYVFEE